MTMVSAYDGILLVAEVCILLFKTIYYILKSTYRLIVPVEEKSVAGEIVLITGTGHGIGKELAFKYASLGATVVCLDLNTETNQETVNEIMKLGATIAHAYQCDVSNYDQVFEVAKKIQSEVGHPTILVNNAGIMPCQLFFDYKPETVRKMMDINVLAHIWMLQAFLPIMVKNNHGHVVAISSMAGAIGLKNLVPYCASKFAVRGLMEALINELGAGSDHIPKSNIKFTTIYPYMVDTGLCKKPRIRFPSLMGLVPPKEVAEYIVMAQRRNYTEISIPRIWSNVNTFLRPFPDQVLYEIKNFINSGVDV